MQFHGGHGLFSPGLGLDAPSKVSHRLLDFPTSALWQKTRSFIFMPMINFEAGSADATYTIEYHEHYRTKPYSTSLPMPENSTCGTHNTCRFTNKLKHHIVVVYIIVGVIIATWYICEGLYFMYGFVHS